MVKKNILMFNYEDNQLNKCHLMTFLDDISNYYNLFQ